MTDPATAPPATPAAAPPAAPTANPALAAMNDSLAAAMASLGRLPTNGISNGDIAANELSPLAGYIPTHMYTLLSADGGAMAAFVPSVCAMSGCNLPALPAGRPSIRASVCVLMGRFAAARLIGGFVQSLNRAECTRATAAVLAQQVHPNHLAEVRRMVEMYTPVAERFIPILTYNAVMISQFGHAHLSESRSKLMSTTLKLSPIGTAVADDPTLEGAVMHDMFHNVGGGILSAAARHPNYVTACGKLGYDNLRARLPLKHANTAPALDYSALYITTKAMVEVKGGIPSGFAVPESLNVAIEAASSAAAGADLIAKVAVVRMMAKELIPACLYMAGYILGRLRQIHDDPDMNIRTAVRTHKVTILGANFIERERGSGVGLAMFTTGISHGVITPTAAELAAQRTSLQALAVEGVAKVAGLAAATPAATAAPAVAGAPAVP